MAEINGKLCTCDRCGKQVFRQCTGEGERDGGFTRWNKFEPYPEGWEWHVDTGTLCPECNSKYKTMIADYMAKVPKQNQNKA